MASTADVLREIADKIDGFPQFIRRDVGKPGLKPTIQAGLAKLGYSDDPELEKFMLDLTEQLRQTYRNYFLGQFDPEKLKLEKAEKNAA